MGSRGAFLNVDMSNFTFREGGKHYMSLGTLSSNANVKIVVQESNAVKAPEYSHTAGRVYAIVKNGELKHLSYYDDAHKQAVCIDLAHDHKGVKPHRHVYLSHNKNDPGVPPTETEMELIKKIKKEYRLK